MIEYTQTNLDPGNCWQTCVASILELPPETLPDQSVCDRWHRPDHENTATWRRLEPYYGNELNAYLRKHHSLTYANVPPYIMTGLLVKPPGIHMLSGETVRTKYNRSTHVVVAKNGELLWDPHPSRAGLTKIIYWSFLVPYPGDWKESGLLLECHCPDCGGFSEEYLDKVAGKVL